MLGHRRREGFHLESPSRCQWGPRTRRPRVTAAEEPASDRDSEPQARARGFSAASATGKSVTGSPSEAPSPSHWQADSDSGLGAARPGPAAPPGPARCSESGSATRCSVPFPGDNFRDLVLACSRSGRKSSERGHSSTGYQSDKPPSRAA
eukprot:3228562-Rhodomonas_salina.2